MENIPEEPGKTVLYKYRSLDTDQHIQFVRDILVNHRLYCAAPNSFNDPFEFRVQISFKAPTKVKIKAAIDRIRKELLTISLSEARKLASARYMELERYGPRNMETLVFGEMGVVSLAGTLNSLLMWSHYAGGHTGLCIEFCASKESHIDFYANAQPVKYQKDFPIIFFYVDEPLIKVQKYLLTKADDWSYERECRIIVHNRHTNQYYDFDPVLIRRIFLGSRISEKHIQTVRSFVNEIPSNIRPSLWHAKQSSSAYSLKFDPIE